MLMQARISLLSARKCSRIKGGFLFCCVIAGYATSGFAQRSSRPAIGNGSVPQTVLLRILKAEDERRWDSDLRDLMTSKSAGVRWRAALAAGRIGSEDSVPALATLLQKDVNVDVRSMAAFAIGETESGAGADVLLAVINTNEPGEVRARAIEALGKIAAALPKEQETRARELGAAVLEALKSESGQRSAPNRLTILLGLTAALRAKATNAGPVIARFLGYSDPRIRADAANTLTRLRLKDGNDQLRKLLTDDADPIVRANAARGLGATEDKSAFDSLLDHALNDNDSRVRVSAIRALGSLKDGRATDSLLKRGVVLAQRDLRERSAETNEVLEIANTLGRLLQSKDDKDTLDWLRKLRETFNYMAPEVEIAFARISPAAYLAEFGNEAAAKRKVQETLLLNWRAGSGIAQGFGEIGTFPESARNRIVLMGAAETLLREMLNYRNSGITINTLVAVHSEYAIPDVLRALAAFKPKDLGEVLRSQLDENDVIIRATAAELLGDLPPTEVNTRALREALPRAMKDELNDAALAILDSLGKQKTPGANEAIKSALDSTDHLLRRKAVALLKTNGAGDFSSRIGTVQTRNTVADYQRALARVDESVEATVSTTKGPFTIELLPGEATLNVDNFIQLAKRGYFNGFTLHRVVPNFVIQDGDPRGDGNGGPGYQIRCEINEVPYDRAAVGMALSGKDTGGSQWFVTHSPQPHLDGGYTVFGRIVAGMEVVDRIVRGDAIRSIVISQSKNRSVKR
jgi:cyclophilin family peptidyl-prolyl cis-trans isomerase/HEAT repeat protein